MDYQEWITRERRYRIKLLRDWPEARNEGVYRICQSCEEICLCAEEICPNCGGSEINNEKRTPEFIYEGTRIRCKKKIYSVIS